MYERSAIVLERYFNNLFGLDERVNLKTNYDNFSQLIEELQKYQTIVAEEENVIVEFDSIANDIRNIQKEQKKLYKFNIKLEEDRNHLFDCFDENPSLIEKKLEKIESAVNKNNDELMELRTNFINCLSIFNERQRERNKCAKARRIEEGNYINIVERISSDLEELDISKAKEVKNFMDSSLDDYKSNLIQIMINNGKDERVKFNPDVITQSVNIRTDIAKKEAEIYIVVFDRLRKLLNEINNDDVKLEKFKKVHRDFSVKLAFLETEKNYIIDFLDNERMTAINGLKIHKKMMTEACKDFECDIKQFDNLYELILKEATGKATKKLYNDLYNKEYLKNIEEKERNFEEEMSSLKIHAGTVINSSYWRIQGIKNIYDVFQKEVSEKFGKDLSDLKIEESEIEVIDDILGLDDFSEEIIKSKMPKRDVVLSKHSSKSNDEKSVFSNDDIFNEDIVEESLNKDEEKIEAKNTNKYIEDYDEFDINYEEKEQEDIDEKISINFKEDVYDDETEYIEFEEDDDEDGENDDSDFEDEQEILQKVNKKFTMKKMQQRNMNIEKEIDNSKGIFNKFFKDKNK